MKSSSRLLAAACFLMGSHPSVHGQQVSPAAACKLPAIIADHMVLQSGQANPIWGWAPAGTAIQVQFLDEHGGTPAQAAANAARDGKWSLKLPALAAGAAGKLLVRAGAEVKTIQDVVVGEAWLCGGQSNMTYDFSAHNIPPAMLDTAREEATAAHGAIRFFVTQGADLPVPQNDSKGSWIVVTPENLGRCSCVAWNFAVALRARMDRPMGMVVCAVGGTRVEQWMSRAAFDASPGGPELAKKYAAAIEAAAPKTRQWELDDAAWLQANLTPELRTQNGKTRPRKPSLPPTIAGLYNGMLHGLEPYGVKGIIWFQADGNLGFTNFYGDLIKTLITSWRADWQQELPFYYVEMNNMRDSVQTVPVKYNELSLLREKQDDALQLLGTDVVSSIDCGLPEPEPHFPNKKPVGQRLALLALDHLYHFPGPCHSPTYQSFDVEGNKIRVHFKDAEGLRVRAGGEMIGFAIRGATGEWVFAQGKVDGQTLLLWNDQIPQPAAVRYAWAANPRISMENGAGLPLRPFRTDTASPQ